MTEVSFVLCVISSYVKMIKTEIKICQLCEKPFSFFAVKKKRTFDSIITS